MNLGKGIIGALAGGVSGYAAGKVSEAESIKQNNIMLLKNIFDRNLVKFREDLESQNEVVGYTEEGAPVTRKDYSGGILYGSGVERPEPHRFVNPDGTPANPDDPGAMDIDAWKTKYGADTRYEAAMARIKAMERKGSGGSSQGEYFRNPKTGVMQWVPKGENPPPGFVSAAFDHAPKGGGGQSSDVAVQNLMGRYGITEGLNGVLTSEPMTAEQKAQVEAEARQMGLNVYFRKQTDDGGWFGKSKDFYTVSAIAPAMEGRGIIGSHYNQPEYGEPRVAPDGKMYRLNNKTGKYEVFNPGGKEKQPKKKKETTANRALTKEQRQKAIQEWIELLDSSARHKGKVRFPATQRRQ